MKHEMTDSSPILCYVTDRHLLECGSSANDLLPRIADAIDAGVNWIQIREKDLSARELLDLACRAMDAARGSVESQGIAHGGNPARVAARALVNDRFDVALAAGASGVHLGAGAVPLAEVVRWCRAGNAPLDFLVGASCHHLFEAIETERAGADYIFFGPVYETPSKVSFGPPQGVGKLAEVCRQVRIPVFAIGGINEENAADCLRAGAAGIAAIRLFQEAPRSASLAALVSRLRTL